MESNRTLPELMDQIYRYERYIFDLTRPFYLIGRDRMLGQIKPEPGQSILEIGSGTARNLLKLYKREARANYTGVDVSKLMIEYAEKKIKKAGATIKLVHLTTQPSAYGQFDQVLISFCLTMIPDPIPVLEAAVKSLKPGGQLWIVDYHDRAGLPVFLARFIGKMMARYHVKANPKVIPFLETLPGDLRIETVMGRVAYIARYLPNNKGPAVAMGIR